MNDCADSIRVMHPLFQVGEGGSIPTSALQLRIVPIGFSLARQLNECWHSSLPKLGTGFIKEQPFPCFGAVYEDRLYAVAIWSNPVARALPQQTWLELRRFAIASDRPRNTASRMLAVMVRLLGRKFPELENLVSYQDMGAHTGTIYKAAGWRATIESGGHNWCNPARHRPPSHSTARKQRWEKPLKFASTPEGEP